MANGELFIEMKACLESNEMISQATVNRMVLAGMIQLHEKIEKMQPALTTYKAIMWVVGISLAAFITGISTGTIGIVFKP